MRVLGINGSPRIGGNTDTLLDKALEGARSKGAETEKIVLNNLKMAPCQECEEINGDGTCKIEDGFQAVNEKIDKADAIILASPIFFGSLSAQTKIMIDRFQCRWHYKYMAKKAKPAKQRPGGLILVEASKRQGFLENAKSIAKNLFATIDLEYKEELSCTGLEGKEAAAKSKDLLAGAFALGQKLVSS